MRREYAGAAQAAKLTTALGGSTSDLTIVCDDLTNWPTGLIGPFYIVIDRGTASEEKILCSSRSGNTMTVYNDGLTNGRAADDTSISSHSLNANVEHVFTATDADEANLHVNSNANVHGVVGSVVGTTDTQTLSGKTLSSPAIVGGTLSGATSIGNVTFTGTVSGFPFIPLDVVTNGVGSYDVTAADAGKLIQMTSALSNGVAFPTSPAIGTVVLVARMGAGITLLQAAAGATVNGTPGLQLRAQYSVACAVKVSSTAWLAYGDLTA